MVKKLWILIFISLCVNMGVAANPRLAKESARALVSALAAELGETQSLVAYIPGYGLHITVVNLEEDWQAEEVLKTLTSEVNGFAETLKGLDANDWVSVAFQGQAGFMTNEYEIIVRLNPATGKLERFLDAKPQ